MRNNQLKNEKELSGTFLSFKEYRQKINTDFTRSSVLNKEFCIDLKGKNTLVLQELSVLLFCKQYTEQLHGTLVLTNVSAILKEFFELTRTDGCFIIKSVSV